jgi:hypothetical protein
MPTPTLTIRVLSKRWKVKVLPHKEYKARYPGTLAVAKPHTKTIVLSIKHASFETVCHEITHAYLDELCMGNALSLKKAQREEAICELMSKFGPRIVAQSLHVVAAHKRLQKRLT